jgi:outer membrane protein assembly factor BamB
VREEARRLVCMAADTGAILWAYKPTEGSILPNSFFGTEHVAVRTRAPDKLIVLDGDGRRRFEISHSGESWDRVPVVIDGHRLCIVTDARTIQLLDLHDGQPVWSYVGPTAEQKPLPIAGEAGLFVLLGGNRLVRLEPDTGTEAWSTYVSDDALPEGNSWAVDSHSFFCITRNVNLRAFRLIDGELEWQQYLTGPGDAWQIAPSGGYLLVLPRKIHVGEGLPVLICQQSNGSFVQRLFFPHLQGTQAFLHVLDRQAVVGSEREVWGVGSKE